MGAAEEHVPGGEQFVVGVVVVGLVGGAGLGWQLLESLSAFNWAQVLLVLIVFVTLTLIGESISDQCRNYWLGTKPLGPAAVALQS